MSPASHTLPLSLLRTFILLSSLLLALSACRVDGGYSVSDLTLERDGWDSVNVKVAFVHNGVLGGSAAASPEEFAVSLFDSRFDTLYAGSDTIIAVPDASLLDGEALLVEVCGTFGKAVVCEQKGLRASSKRIRVRQRIDYPQNGDIERGNYDFDFVVERQVWNSEEWETIDRSRDVRGFVLAYVDGFEEEGVKIPFGRRTGRFNLARLDNFRDFRYYLRSKLLEENEARVRFAVYAGLGGDEVRVADDEKIIRKKAREIRELEAGYFVEQAAREILGRLTSFFGPSRSYVYLDSWQFVEGERHYTIDIELTWSSSFFRQRWYRISGTLRVDENGGGASFLRMRGNERGIERWHDRIDGNELRLGDLEPRPEADTRFSFHDED